MKWFRRSDTPITSVQVLDLRPDDRLILEVGSRITPAQAADIRKQFARASGAPVDRVIVVQNATVKVLREGEPPPPPVILSPGIA